MPVCEEGPDLVGVVRAGFKEQIAALRGEDWVMGHPVLNEAGGGARGSRGQTGTAVGAGMACPYSPYAPCILLVAWQIVCAQ